VAEKKKKLPVGLMISALVVAAAILLARHFHIKNFHVVEPGVLYTSGQPRGMDYTRLLYKYHIATIVNVRSVDEHRERHWYNEEVSWVRNNGIKYEELPIERASYFPDGAAQAKILEIISDKTNLPVLIHGSSGKERVAMLVAVWLVASEKYSMEEVAGKTEEIKGDPLTEAETEFLGELIN
jgi:protein tyrosine/serine phosphatase